MATCSELRPWPIGHDGCRSRQGKEAPTASSRENTEAKTGKEGDGGGRGKKRPRLHRGKIRRRIRRRRRGEGDGGGRGDRSLDPAASMLVEALLDHAAALRAAGLHDLAPPCSMLHNPNNMAGRRSRRRLRRRWQGCLASSSSVAATSSPSSALPATSHCCGTRRLLVSLRLRLRNLIGAASSTAEPLLHHTPGTNDLRPHLKSSGAASSPAQFTPGEPL